MLQDIKHIAKQSWMCHNISLSHLCINGNELLMSHDCNQLKFMFTDNSKPLHYKEIVFVDDANATVVDKVFNDKFKGIAYDFPYITITKPARLIEDTVGMFRTGEYTLVDESTHKEPDYNEIENIIIKVLNKFNENQNNQSI